MSNLSPRYRNDQPDGLAPEIKAYLDQHFLPQLANLTVPHPKLLVVFAGGNAVGKSTLSERLGHDLQGLILENDLIKACLLQFDPTLAEDRDQLDVLTWQYSMDLYSRLSELTPNGLIIRDGVIHWYFDRILPLFEKQGYSLFIITYDLSREKRLQLIRARGDKPTVNVERLITIMEDHDIHMKRFAQHYPADYTFTDDNLFAYEPVVAKIRARLAELPPKR